jgi:hypothetical protein
VHGEVGAVGPLGDQQAEVEGGSGDALGCVFGAVRPYVVAPVVAPRRRHELDAELLLRHAQPPYGEGEVTRPDADTDDVAEPGGGGAYDAERVGDVLPVGPGFHDPPGGHGGGGHRRPEPAEARAGRCRSQRDLQDRPAVTPAGQEFGGRESGVLLGAHVDEGVR